MAYYYIYLILILSYVMFFAHNSMNFKEDFFNSVIDNVKSVHQDSRDDIDIRLLKIEAKNANHINQLNCLQSRKYKIDSNDILEHDKGLYYNINQYTGSWTTSNTCVFPEIDLQDDINICDTQKMKFCIDNELNYNEKLSYNDMINDSNVCLFADCVAKCTDVDSNCWTFNDNKFIKEVDYRYCFPEIYNTNKTCYPQPNTSLCTKRQQYFYSDYNTIGSNYMQTSINDKNECMFELVEEEEGVNYYVSYNDASNHCMNYSPLECYYDRGDGMSFQLIHVPIDKRTSTCEYLNNDGCITNLNDSYCTQKRIVYDIKNEQQMGNH